VKVTILGCGTSFGVPMINCRCEVCTSANPKDKRLRASIMVQYGGRTVLIDTATDLRQQAMANGIERIDTVLYTHAHAEHIHGIDELRRFNWIQGEAIPCYGSPDTMKAIERTFQYIFVNPGLPGWQPNLTSHYVDGPFELFGQEVVPVEVMHGKMPILGYRFGGFAYITDFSSIPDKSMFQLEGLDVMLLEALRYDPHPAHVSLDEAKEVVRTLKPKRAIFTHMAHTFGYDGLSAELPDGMELAYDGMVIEL